MTLRIRRGGGTQGAPPPPITYGPSNGPQSVRDGAGPRTVTNPGGGISFNSSASLQSAIDANPTSSTFVCSVNNPVWNSGVSCGTKAPTIIFPGTVGQCVINAGGATIPFFWGADNYTVRGGWFTSSNYVFSAFNLQSGCVLEDAVVTTNLGTSASAVGTSGLNTRISYCRMTNNGLQGLQGKPAIVEYCEISGNNTSQHDPGDTGGAHKFNNNLGGWYHHNWVHDNIGYGAWWDTANVDWTIEENVCEGNYRAGLFWEANNPGGTLIRRNYVANNGSAATIGPMAPDFWNNNQVLLNDNVGTSGNPIEFTQNIVDYTLTQTADLGGLLLIWNVLTTGSRHAESNHVFGNQFWLRGNQTTNEARVGGLDTQTASFPVWSLDNVFSSNEYRVANTTRNYWSWGTGTQQGSPQTFSAWQGFHPSGETRVLI